MTVYLVGAGPGDPELLTLKAARLLDSADAVVYDRLVSPECLALVQPGAELIFAGKRAGFHHSTQDEINELLLDLTRRHDTVVRLKGGDPYMFGRGGEEALYLNEHGVQVEVIPGITAAASSAYAGFPLTHRGVASGVVFIAGHCRASQPLEIDWRTLAAPELTVVIYMGLAQADHVAEQMIAAGRAPSTPAALIERGSLPEQRMSATTLQSLGRVAKEDQFRSPTLLIVGDVVSIAESLNSCVPSTAFDVPTSNPVMLETEHA